MDITIHTSALPHDDPDASLAFWRDALGFEVRNDVGKGKMRWIRVGAPGQPDTSILLAPPVVDPGVTDDERRTVIEMMAKGTYGWILPAPSGIPRVTSSASRSGAKPIRNREAWPRASP
jgi:catechol 2,3-dioxygenase-like lactoylglutathione lyase family enzyme